MPVVNDDKFMKDMNNILAYAEGFLEGARRGKTNMLNNLGDQISTLIGEFIDSSATVDPASLSHVYEWYQNGSSAARLFDINYKVTGKGLSMGATFTQSRSIRSGSKEPFYNKAKVMEAGIPVTISPRSGGVLVFDDNGDVVFTKKPVIVRNPGGSAAADGFDRTFKTFFTTYASQSILDISGLGYYLRSPQEFKANLQAGRTGGRSVGISTGFDWISRKVA